MVVRGSEPCEQDVQIQLRSSASPSVDRIRVTMARGKTPGQVGPEGVKTIGLHPPCPLDGEQTPDEHELTVQIERAVGGRWIDV